MEIEQKESSSQTRNIETEFSVKNGETKKFCVHVVQNLGGDFGQFLYNCNLVISEKVVQEPSDERLPSIGLTNSRTWYQ